jgi:XTP/dITP diphosphohydrolase
VGAQGEPEETGTTFEANAALKARYYARLTGLPTLADDSGREVDAPDGGPGVRTKRYSGADATDASNNAKLLGALRGLPAARRGARYVCVLALADPTVVGPRGGLPISVVRGTFRGRIATAAKGANGFGYDPIFEPSDAPTGGRTVGELPPEEKNRRSHRAVAARRMAPILRARGF